MQQYGQSSIAFHERFYHFLHPNIWYCTGNFIAHQGTVLHLSAASLITTTPLDMFKAFDHSCIEIDLQIVYFTTFYIRKPPHKWILDSFPFNKLDVVCEKDPWFLSIIPFLFYGDLCDSVVFHPRTESLFSLGFPFFIVGLPTPSSLLNAPCSLKNHSLFSKEKTLCQVCSRHPHIAGFKLLQLISIFAVTWGHSTSKSISSTKSL